MTDAQGFIHDLQLRLAGPPTWQTWLTESGWVPFILISILVGGGAAYMAGRATARAWRPIWSLILYMALLSLAVRFLHYGVALPLEIVVGTEGWVVEIVMLQPLYLARDFLICLIAALLGFRLERVRQMTRQYGWAWKRTTPLTYRRRDRLGA